MLPAETPCLLGQCFRPRLLACSANASSRESLLDLGLVEYPGQQPFFQHFILVVSTWVQQSKSVRTRGSKSRGKMSLQNRQILENLLGNIKIFPHLKSNFPPPKSDFLQRLSVFLNGFPLSSTAFWFSSTAFHFPQRLSDFPQRLSTFQEIQENLSTVASIQKIATRASYFPPLAPRAS
jgi:hypothetical protein